MQVGEGQTDGLDQRSNVASSGGVQNLSVQAGGQLVVELNLFIFFVVLEHSSMRLVMGCFCATSDTHMASLAKKWRPSTCSASTI